MRNANWLQMLTNLMEEIQDHETLESEEALQKWAKERDEIRQVRVFKVNILL
jgi:hypothetical protein